MFLSEGSTLLASFSVTVELILFQVGIFYPSFSRHAASKQTAMKLLAGMFWFVSADEMIELIVTKTDNAHDNWEMVWK